MNKPAAASSGSLVGTELDGKILQEEKTQVARNDILLQNMQQFWGYSGYRSLQREAMATVMADRDSLVVLPTGGGKSLCYQVPAISRNGLALVISPLISLMKDQVDSLQEIGIAAACINSMQTSREKIEVADRIRRRELKLLYIAPERLVQPRTISFLRDAGVSFVAIDEAHCISEWGHDFRPEYRQLRMLRDTFPGIAVHGYTATATEVVRADILRQLQLRDASVLVGSFDRPNLRYRVERRSDAIGQIQRILHRHRGESGIIYCISRRNVEQTSEILNRLGFQTRPYHAGMSDADRRGNQEAFIDENVQIIVATVAFGMGIDKSNVRFVIHAEMPRSLESYQQESGRAGRDGLEAECVLLYSADDVNTWEFLMQDVEDGNVRQVGQASLQAMQQYCISTRCRHAQLVEHFGQHLASDNCGACDVCLQEMEAVADALIVGQKILSSIVRQGERFGAAYTAQVLRGSKAKRIVENGHDQLSTWGLLKDQPEPHIRNWIDQLLSQGFLRQAGEFNCLEVTPSGRQLLKGQLTPVLFKARIADAAVTHQDSWEGVDRNLFAELRNLRSRLAVRKNVAPYIVFDDATLRDLARRRPTREDALLSIHGFGAKKQKEFGAVVVQTIQRWCEEHDLETDVEVQALQQFAAASGRSASRVTSEAVTSIYFDLFEQGLSMQEVAQQLDRSLDTVSKHLSTWLEAHRISDIDAWIPPALQTQVNQAIGQLGCERLKPLFEYLNAQVSYADLRIVAVAWKLQQSSDQ